MPATTFGLFLGFLFSSLHFCAVVNSAAVIFMNPCPVVICTKATLGCNIPGGKDMCIFQDVAKLFLNVILTVEFPATMYKASIFLYVDINI